MAEDQFQATGNWWDSARNSRFETEASQSSSSIPNFAWQHTDMSSHQDLKPRSSMAASPSSSDPNLHMMGLGLSSQPLDWNQPSFLRGAEKGGESSFLNASSTNFQQESAMGLSQVQWRDKLFSAESSSSTNEFKQVNRGFSLDQTQFSPQYSSGESTVTTQGLASSTNFQVDFYGNSSILQGLLPPDHNNNSQVQYDHHQNRQINFPYQTSYGLNSNDQLMPSWSNKVPQFLRASPPKQQPPHNNNQLHFTNNAPFWNASEASNIKDARSGFFPSLQPPFPSPSFDVQSKNMCEVRESSSVVKKSGSEAAPKRPRNETPSPLPAFKVRKEKMGDRITALQQLVSPFGKTDTASVLSEAIEYIKFLHEQVLSTPYMKSGAPIQHQQSPGKSKEGDGGKQDLRSRGLCLVPMSSTFPVTQETAVDFWTPTFGGTFR
ncbi:transcription factor bHLH123-like isoform X2 [Neltuma alba]|uniref:transcription factor bHLH123-like isoform X2 n=1 Tax=Neltuma alba TaxID=207710 RepID=UPI0010A3F206|nr:transcription factor bHLH123-like isoform X2 [Prosopis alba]XP_028761835.1 transcription factor bHLH123-like isoform X2 [Prosopis alba]